MTCKKRDILPGIIFKTPLLHHSISLCSFHVLCFLSLTTGNAGTSGNQAIHDPGTAEVSSVKSLQDTIVYLENNLSAMNAKMVRFTYSCYQVHHIIT